MIVSLVKFALPGSSLVKLEYNDNEGSKPVVSDRQDFEPEASWSLKAPGTEAAPAPIVRIS